MYQTVTTQLRDVCMNFLHLYTPKNDTTIFLLQYFRQHLKYFVKGRTCCRKTYLVLVLVLRYSIDINIENF